MEATHEVASDLHRLGFIDKQKMRQYDATCLEPVRSSPATEPMSKHETPMTRRYWQSVGGTLIEEFTAVRRGVNQQVRRLDGVIVLNGQFRLARQEDVTIKGCDIIVIQTKCSRLGMNLMGQAFFSRELMRAFEPRSIRTVALCRHDDAALHPLCEQFGIEVVVQAPDRPQTS